MKEPHASKGKLSARGTVHSAFVFLVTFFVAWAVLGMFAHVLIPLDPPVAPENKAENDRLSWIVGTVVIALSGGIAFLELHHKRRRTHRQQCGDE